MFSDRQEKIIKILLQADRPLLGKELAKNFTVTTRTLRSDISAINQMLKSYHVQIQANHSAGYWIEEGNKTIFEENISYIPLVMKNENMIPSNAKEREIFICFKLLMENDYIIMDVLADILYVSKTTVSKDVKHIQSLVKSICDISFIISTVRGIRFEGEEEAKRKLFSVILLYYYESNLNFLKMALVTFGLNTKNEMVQTYNSLMEYFNHKKIILTDKGLTILSMEILIGIQRKKLGLELKTFTLYQGRKTLPFKKLEDIYQVNLNEIDRHYFLKLYSDKRVILPYTRKSDSTILAERVMARYFKVVMEQYGIDLSIENDLKDHINAMLLHMHSDSWYSEKLISDIKSNYPFAYQLASMMNPVLKQLLNIELAENELASITARLVVILDRSVIKKNAAIICGCSLSYAYLLRFKLDNYFSNRLNIVGIYPLYQLDKLVKSNTDLDLIISTIAISHNYFIDIIQINTIISQEDINKINNYLQRKNKSYIGV